MYSILYVLDFSKFMSIIKETEMDYELYSYLRDKICNVPDEF
jgi:hypothetical protein